MTHDSRIKLNAQISEEAAEWFIDFRTGDIDAAGRRAFNVWVRSSQEHLRAYLETAAIWNECAGLDAQRAWDTDALIALADENVVPFTLRDSDAPTGDSRAQSASESLLVVRQRWTRSRLAALAACVVLLISAGGAVTWFQSNRLHVYATEVGEQRSVRLADGSTIELNSRSRVRIRFSESERRVELLEGQALFHVAKNAARPFIVSSGETHVRAVGTRFDVNKKANGTVVTVVEGKVAVVSMEGGGVQVPELRKLDKPILLTAGEQLVIAAQEILPPTRVNPTAATAWIHRQLVLESAPLAEVAAEFNRYSTRKLVVEDLGSNELRLSGVFETDPDFLIRYLRERTDITVHETDSEIRIVRHD